MRHLLKVSSFSAALLGVSRLVLYALLGLHEHFLSRPAHNGGSGRKATMLSLSQDSNQPRTVAHEERHGRSMPHIGRLDSGSILHFGRRQKFYTNTKIHGRQDGEHCTWDLGGVDRNETLFHTVRTRLARLLPGLLLRTPVTTGMTRSAAGSLQTLLAAPAKRASHQYGEDKSQKTKGHSNSLDATRRRFIQCDSGNFIWRRFTPRSFPAHNLAARHRVLCARRRWPFYPGSESDP